MKLFKKSVITLASLAALSMAGSANATLTNWFIDTDGIGGNAAVQVEDYVDLNGRAYVHNTIGAGGNFTFNESGTFISNLADSATPLTPQLNSTFTGTGSGNTALSTLQFSTGTLTIKSGATTIGTFNLLAGSAVLNANSTLPNGTVSLIFEATQIAAGYFFDSAMTDLSTINPQELVFGFATTNAIDQSPLVVPTALVTLYNDTFAPDQVGPIVSNQTTDLLLSNNGQFRLAVPEPGSLALLGIGLLGFAGARRRNK